MLTYGRNTTSSKSAFYKKYKKNQSIENIYSIDPTSKHELIRVISAFPCYCHSCKDFNVAGKDEYFKCNRCKLTWHSSVCCKDTISKDEKCEQKDIQYLNEDVLPSVEFWSTQDVLSWMYCCRLNQLHNFIFNNQINGKKLIAWKESAINFNIIPNDSYYFALNEAINLLLNKKERKVDKRISIDILRLCTYSVKHGIFTKRHEFKLKTFKINTLCDVCNQCLVGTHKQGIICLDCNYTLHQCCKRNEYFDQLCKVDGKNCISNSVVEIFPDIKDAKIFLKNCFAYLEKFPKYYFEAFENYPNPIKYSKIRNEVEKDYNSNFLADLDDTFMSAVAFVILDFFLEHQTNLITEDDYFNMMKYLDTNDVSLISSCKKQLSVEALSILEILSKHIINMAKNNELDRKKMSKLYGNFFVIPPSTEFDRYPKILEKHQKLFEELIKDYSNEKSNDLNYESINNIITDVKKPVCEDEILEMQDYYYAELEKAQVVNIVSNQSNGNFLVRKSTKKYNYVLVFVYNNKVRMLTINEKNGTYGIGKNCSFLSVVDIISHYQCNSLSSVCQNIDIKLNLPIDNKSKYNENPTAKLKQVESLINKAEVYLENVSIAAEKESEELDQYTNRLLCETTLQNLFSDYYDETNQFCDSIKFRKSEKTEKEYLNRLKNIEKLIKYQKDVVKEVDILVYNNGLKKEEMEAKIIAAKQNIKSLNNFKAKLLEKSQGGEKISIKDFFYQNLTRREISAKYLNKPNGTFAVVISERDSKLVVCVIHNHMCYNIRIQKNKGYFLSKNDNKFPSFEALINYYYMNQIPINSKDMTLFLKTPLTIS